MFKVGWWLTKESFEKNNGNRGWIKAKIVEGYRGGHHLALHPLKILTVHQVYTDN